MAGDYGGSEMAIFKFWAVTTVGLKWRFEVWGRDYGGSGVAIFSSGR